MNRRKFLANGIIAGGAMALTPVVHAKTETERKVRVIGISCSPRKGMTTATGVQVTLDAAKDVDGRIQTELIDLGGMIISGWNGTGKFQEDDFERFVLPILCDPVPDGLITGSPVYFRNNDSED